MNAINIIVHPSEDGRPLYWAESPNYPGCFAEGGTIAETLDDWGKALASHLASYDDPADAYVPTAPVGRHHPATRRLVRA